MVEVSAAISRKSRGRRHRLDKLDLELGPVFALSDREVPGDVQEVIGSGTLDGQDARPDRTAEMHLALASDPDDPAFAPEPLTVEEMAQAVG